MPYNNDVIQNGKSYNYIFIFKVPKTYKSNKYTIKFYDRIVYENDESKGSYKEIKAKAKSLDKKRNTENVNFNENVILNKNSYGNSSITITGYDIKNNYTYTKDGKTNIIRDKDINNVLLILDYKLELDKDSLISNYFADDKEFFNKFVTISYNNNYEHEINKISVVGNIDGKVMLAVPNYIEKSSNINLNIELRNTKITYKLK